MGVQKKKQYKINIRSTDENCNVLLFVTKNNNFGIHYWFKSDLCQNIIRLSRNVHIVTVKLRIHTVPSKISYGVATEFVFFLWHWKKCVVKKRVKLMSSRSYYLHICWCIIIVYNGTSWWWTSWPARVKMSLAGIRYTIVLKKRRRILIK